MWTQTSTQLSKRSSNIHFDATFNPICHLQEINVEQSTSRSLHNHRRKPIFVVSCMNSHWDEQLFRESGQNIAIHCGCLWPIRQNLNVEKSPIGKFRFLVNTTSHRRSEETFYSCDFDGFEYASPSLRWVMSPWWEMLLLSEMFRDHFKQMHSYIYIYI